MGGLSELRNCVGAGNAMKCKGLNGFSEFIKCAGAGNARKCKVFQGFDVARDFDGIKRFEIN